MLGELRSRALPARLHGPRPFCVFARHALAYASIDARAPPRGGVRAMQVAAGGRDRRRRVDLPALACAATLVSTSPRRAAPAQSAGRARHNIGLDLRGRSRAPLRG